MAETDAFLEFAAGLTTLSEVRRLSRPGLE